MLSVIRASAGSGKTFTLAKDYIKMLLGIKDPDTDDYQLNLYVQDSGVPSLRWHYRHRHILAITFTRKATEEMKTRILERLDQLSDPNAKSPYEQELIKLFRCTRTELADTAQLALREILFDYQNFNISTIDAFFQRVLHTFARELDHQSDYTVELDDIAAMKSAVGNMLDDFNCSYNRDEKYDSSRDSLESWLYEYMSQQIDDAQQANFLNRTSNVHTNLVKLLSNINKETFNDFLPSMRDYLKERKLDLYVKDVNRNLAKIRSKLPDYVKGHIDEDTLSIIKGNIGVKARIERVKDGEILNPKEFDTKNIIQLLEGNANDVFRARMGTETQKALIVEVMQEIYQQSMLYFLLSQIKACLPQLGLLSFSWHYLDQFSKENNTLLISHTNDLVHRIIGHDETPFIYERMGCRLQHFLIDEFQDTSTLQWRNLSPLVANALGEKNDSLVIGDEKQSIYRFRNSDSSILHSGIENQMGKYMAMEDKETKRSTNYRSSADVVTFNNRLFSSMASIVEATGYENVEQNISADHAFHRGCVRLYETGDAKKKEAKEKADTILMSNSEEVLHHMAKIILRQHEIGQYDWRQIAVLVNTNREAAKVVNFLLQNYPQISILSDEALRLTSSPAILQIINLLKILDKEGTIKPSDDERFLSQSQATMALHRFEYLMNEPEISITQAVEQALAEMGSGTLPLFSEVKNRRPSSIVALIDAILDTHLTEKERSQQFAYIAAFQDLVLDFTSRHDASLHAFLDWWDNTGCNATISGEAEADAVRVMTIHSSKGLEFECVHLPMCNWNLTWNENVVPQVWLVPPDLPYISSEIKPPAIFMPLSKQFEKFDNSIGAALLAERKSAIDDTMNKTYVAFTRAVSELHIWYKNSNSCIGEVISNALSANPEIASLIENEDIDSELSPLSIRGIGGPTLAIDSPAIREKQKQRRKEESIKMTYPLYRHPQNEAILSVADNLELDRSLDDSQQSKPEEHDLYESDEARQQGLILHEMMEWVRTERDVSKAVAIVGRKYAIPLEQRKALSNIIANHVSQVAQEGYGWYDEKKTSAVHIEQWIYVPNLDKSRRPDRVVEIGDSHIVIDYKFTDSSAAIGSESHLLQVKEYMSLMRDMGYHKVDGYVAYPRFHKIVKVN